MNFRISVEPARPFGFFGADAHPRFMAKRAVRATLAVIPKSPAPRPVRRFIVIIRSSSAKIPEIVGSEKRDGPLAAEKVLPQMALSS
jgi:hypothetical protein